MQFDRVHPGRKGCKADINPNIWTRVHTLNPPAVHQAHLQSIATKQCLIATNRQHTHRSADVAYSHIESCRRLSPSKTAALGPLPSTIHPQGKGESTPYIPIPTRRPLYCCHRTTPNLHEKAAFPPLLQSNAPVSITNEVHPLGENTGKAVATCSLPFVARSHSMTTIQGLTHTVYTTEPLVPLLRRQAHGCRQQPPDVQHRRLQDGVHMSCSDAKPQGADCESPAKKRLQTPPPPRSCHISRTDLPARQDMWLVCHNMFRN